MNLLVDRLPQTVLACGQEWPIRTNFRVGILFELLMQDPRISDEEKLLRALSLYYPQLPNDLGAASKGLIWFYRCGEDTPQKQADTKGVPQRIYSFEQDAGRIFAAFQATYQIDLNDVEYLHWWKFRVMFSELPEESSFGKVMGYRAMRITSEMTPAQRQFYGRMKALYKLPDERSEDEKTRAFASIFAGGLRV